MRYTKYNYINKTYNYNNNLIIIVIIYWTTNKIIVTKEYNYVVKVESEYYIIYIIIDKPAPKNMT